LYISCFILIKFINIRVTQCLPQQRLLLHLASRPARRTRPSGGHVVRLLINCPVTLMTDNFFYKSLFEYRPEVKPV